MMLETLGKAADFVREGKRPSEISEFVLPFKTAFAEMPSLAEPLAKPLQLYAFDRPDVCVVAVY